VGEAKFGLGTPEGVQGKVGNPPHSLSLNFLPHGEEFLELGRCVDEEEMWKVFPSSYEREIVLWVGLSLMRSPPFTSPFEVVLVSSESVDCYRGVCRRAREL
jgi:hypothetical protein